jgi:hypothetical protein
MYGVEQIELEEAETIRPPKHPLDLWPIVLTDTFPCGGTSANLRASCGITLASPAPQGFSVSSTKFSITAKPTRPLIALGIRD